MGRAVLLACMPWLALLLASAAVVWLLMHVNRARPRLSRLRELPRDQLGSVQSLSFVLTLPFFVMVILLIVQVSQLMIGTMVVHYAAYAAARSAAVWIPANMPTPEGANCVSGYYIDPEATHQAMPILDSTDPNFGPAAGGMTFVLDPAGAKYAKVFTAAVMACAPIAPSRDVGAELPPQGSLALAVLQTAYAAVDADADDNPRIPDRLRNKLAYAMQNTAVEVRFYHKNTQPPLVPWFVAPDQLQFYFNELGWEDTITVTVKHHLALLPGPGRLLARYIVAPAGTTDRVSERIARVGDVYVVLLEASAVTGNEGQMPVIPYVRL